MLIKYIINSIRLVNEIAFTMHPESLHHLLLIADGVVTELHRDFLCLRPDLGTVCTVNIIGDIRCHLFIFVTYSIRCHYSIAD